MNKTSIEWTHRPETGGAAGGFTWNPIRARLTKFDAALNGRQKSGTFCTRISPGCTHCYASTINKRFGNGLEYTVPNLEKVEFYIDEKILAQPLDRKKPATIFVGDMFDLFHEAIPDELILSVYRRMRDANWHTYQVLTKRAERMRSFVSRLGGMLPQINHIWHGVSVEDQPRADERIPLLQQIPTAVRFLSVEPQLEDIYIQTHLMGQTSCGRPHWVIVGGESGPGARPFDLAWAESLLEQCKAAEVPFFCKQLGSSPQVHSYRNESCTHPDCGMQSIRLRDRKGGDPSEWPEHLRVREFPA